MQPSESFSFAFESILIVWHCERISKANFLDKAEVKQTVRLKVRRGEIVCALCSGMLTVHGCYSRHCLDEAGKSHDGWVAQGHCDACNVYPALVPSFIVPHKHYMADVIARVIEGAEAGDNVEHLGACAADISTMRRWVRDFKAHGGQAASLLASKLPDERRAHFDSHDFHNMTLLQRLSRLLGEFPALMPGGVIGNANIILTTHNCGFL